MRSLKRVVKQKKLLRGLIPKRLYSRAGDGLNVKVEIEFLRMRTQFHIVHLILRLIIDPHVDDVRRKYIAFEQEFVIILQCIQGIFQGTGCGWYLSQFLRR